MASGTRVPLEILTNIIEHLLPDEKQPLDTLHKSDLKKVFTFSLASKRVHQLTLLYIVRSRIIDSRKSIERFQCQLRKYGCYGMVLNLSLACPPCCGLPVEKIANLLPLLVNLQTLSCYSANSLASWFARCPNNSWSSLTEITLHLCRAAELDKVFKLTPNLLHLHVATPLDSSLETDYETETSSLSRCVLPNSVTTLDLLVWLNVDFEEDGEMDLDNVPESVPPHFLTENASLQVIKAYNNDFLSMTRFSVNDSWTTKSV